MGLFMQYLNNKLLIWGGGTTTAVRIQWLKKNYNVVAIVLNDEYLPEEVCGVKTIRKDDVGKYEFDYVLLSTILEETENLRFEIKERGITEDKILRIKDVTVDEEGIDVYAEEIVIHQIEVLKEIINATDEDISNYEWMLEKVQKYGIFPFGYDWCSDENTYYVLYGLQQIPEEFAAFCASIGQLKIETAMEIGVYRGRSSFFLSAILGRNNPELKYYMVDLVDRLEEFDRYKKVLPWLYKCIPSDSQKHKGEEYDFVFIDADHSYDNSIMDYNNVGQYAKKMVVFHDIFAHEYDNENGGTVRMWKEVVERTNECEHRVYSKYPDKWMGIGVVIKNEGCNR